MTDQQSKEALKLIILTNLTVESITELRDTNLYRKNVKQHARMLESSLLREYGVLHKEIHSTDSGVYMEMMQVIEDICNHIAGLDVNGLIDLNEKLRDNE